jgi:hypothetical protein
MAIDKQLLKDTVDKASGITDVLKGELKTWIDNNSGYASLFVPYDSFDEAHSVLMDFDDAHKAVTFKNSFEYVTVFDSDIDIYSTLKMYDDNLYISGKEKCFLLDLNLNLLLTYSNPTYRGVADSYDVIVSGQTPKTYIVRVDSSQHMFEISWYTDRNIYSYCTFGGGSGGQALSLNDLQTKMSHPEWVAVDKEASSYSTLVFYVAHYDGVVNDNGAITKYTVDLTSSGTPSITIDVVFYSPNAKGLDFGEISKPYWLHINNNQLYIGEISYIGIYNLNDTEVPSASYKIMSLIRRQKSFPTQSMKKLDKVYGTVAISEFGDFIVLSNLDITRFYIIDSGGYVLSTPWEAVEYDNNLYIIDAFEKNLFKTSKPVETVYIQTFKVDLVGIINCINPIPSKEVDVMASFDAINWFYVPKDDTKLVVEDGVYFRLFPHANNQFAMTSINVVYQTVIA